MLAEMGRNICLERLLTDYPRMPVKSPQPPIPDGYSEPNACTENASELEGWWRDTRMAVGYAKSPDQPGVWTDHAWLVTADGQVIDPTWTDTDGRFVYVEITDDEDDPEIDPFAWRATSVG